MSTWPAWSLVLPRTVSGWAETIFLTPERVPRPSTESEFFTTAKKYKFKNGIAAFEWGKPEQPIVILVHGWSGRGTQMGAFAGTLVASGFRVIAVDGPAHGDSYGQTTHVGEYAQFLIEIQKELNKPFRAIIAHSFGAGCSVLSAARGLKVEKIVLVAGPSRYELVVDNYLNQLRLSPKSRMYFKERLAEKVKIPVSQMNVGVIGNTLPLRALIIHDKDDKEVSVNAAEEIKSNWPSAELIVTSGLGHRRILKDSKVTQAAKDFIL